MGFVLLLDATSRRLGLHTCNSKPARAPATELLRGFARLNLPGATLFPESRSNDYSARTTLPPGFRYSR